MKKEDICRAKIKSENIESLQKDGIFEELQYKDDIYIFYERQQKVRILVESQYIVDRKDFDEL